MSTTNNNISGSSGGSNSKGNVEGNNEKVTPLATGKEPNRFSATNKSARSGRKISLPWFRQNSLTSSSALSRQHTIDSPGSYRYFKQVSENNAKVDDCSFYISFIFSYVFFFN